MDTHEIVVIGGGPAGLQAALTLGRMHHDVLLLDSGEYRNAPADAMHNLIGHDGQSPADFRAAARVDLAAYDGVRVRTTAATAVRTDDAGFAVDLGGESVLAERVILATGVRDTLPDVPGLADLFGSVVAACPYCHGHEYAGRPVAILGSGPHAARVAALMGPIASSVTVYADGAVRAVRPAPGGADLELADGSTPRVGGLFVATGISQSAPFAAQLGLTLQESGCIRVDELGRTSLPGVYAAGDLAHTDAFPMPMASVLTAAAAGMMAATAVDMDRLVGAPQVLVSQE